MANENEVDTSNNVKDKDEEDGDRGSWQTWVLAQERKAQGQRVEVGLGRREGRDIKGMMTWPPCIFFLIFMQTPLYFILLPPFFNR
jgi:hypothetical protein